MVVGDWTKKGISKENEFPRQDGYVIFELMSADPHRKGPLGT